MTPDIEELIKKVNTLTLDKTRLKQKLAQLGQGANRNASNSPKEALQSLSLSSQSSTANSSDDSIIKVDSSSSNSRGLTNSQQLPNGGTGFNKTVSGDLTSATSSLSSTTSMTIGHKNNNITNSPTSGSNVIAGVECSSSCEEDLLFMNELFRKRLDEYSENWDYIQSKCSALLSELTALQKHYDLLKKEKLDLEEKLKFSCDEKDKIKSELQTVVLNYETQLSAMSEHLTMVANQVSLGDM